VVLCSGAKYKALKMPVSVILISWPLLRVGCRIYCTSVDRFNIIKDVFTSCDPFKHSDCLYAPPALTFSNSVSNQTLFCSH
jgi:hypothetical protein